ncbi:hypothetical protein AB0J86_07180 [Micromonospora sp. NPDC049559]|uniref:hypothetical protein n=1 Tax=Micromonospora sp. NPDC049559 TaxID=3155923 RepID=UPI003423BA69
MTTSADAILIGGPREGNTVPAGDAGLVELKIDGLIHRYIRTTQQREHDGAALTVYNYDGAVSPTGGESGTEPEPERLASPMASGQAEPLRPEG